MVEILRDTPRWSAMKEALRGVNAQLGLPGAVARAADAVMELLG